jgi:transposase
MTAKIRIVVLDAQQKARLEGMLRRGRWTPRQLTRARILLMTNEHSSWSNTTIGKEVQAGRETVRSIRNRFLDEGLDAALYDRPRPGQPRKLNAKDEAFIIATACTKAPQGSDHWTLVLLKKKLQQVRRVPVSTESIRRVLLNNNLKPWRKKNVVHTNYYAGV